MHRRIDKERDENEQRKEMHRRIDKERDETEQRLEMHKIIDMTRNTKESRKVQLSDYEKTDRRIRYVNQRNNIQYRKKLLDTFTTDTGFDVVCLSCMQFKSFQYCKPISKLDIEKRRRFLVEDYIFARTKYGADFVCNICFQNISKGIKPKKSRIEAIKFENFPIDFQQSLQRKCISSTPIDKDHLTEDDLTFDVQSFKLNRL